MILANLNSRSLPQDYDRRPGQPIDLQGVQERDVSAVALHEHSPNFIYPLQGRQLVDALVGDSMDIAGDVNDGAAHRSAHCGRIEAPVRGRDTQICETACSTL